MTERTKTTAPSFATMFGGAKEDRPALAATLMVGALALLGLQDSLIKLTSSSVSLWQFQLLRSGINLSLLLVFSYFVWGLHNLVPKRLWAVALRSTCQVGAMFFFFAGIPFLSLTEIAAGLYVFPLFIAVLSTIVLGERVGPRRIFAILTGFTGAVLILKPGTASFQPYALLPVGAGLFYAATILITRKLCREESPVALSFGVSIAFVSLGILGLLITTGLAVFELAPDMAVQWPYLFTGWHPLEGTVLAIIAACSCLNVTANIGLSKAYQSAESSWLAPFDYSYLIFATFWGIVMWNDVPDQWSFTGMAMIAGAGIYVAWRERQESQIRQAEMNRPVR